MAIQDLRGILESNDADVKVARDKVSKSLVQVERSLAKTKSDISILSEYLHQFFSANTKAENDSKLIIEAHEAIRNLEFTIKSLQGSKGKLYEAKRALGRMH